MKSLDNTFVSIEKNAQDESSVDEEAQKEQEEFDNQSQSTEDSQSNDILKYQENNKDNVHVTVNNNDVMLNLIKTFNNDKKNFYKSLSKKTVYIESNQPHVEYELQSELEIDEMFSCI